MVVFPGVICLAMAILAFVSGDAMPLWALLAVEGLLANIPGSSQKLSMQFYLRGILTGIEDAKRGTGDSVVEFWRQIEPIASTNFLSPMESSLRLLIVIALAVVACSWIITRRQFVLTS